MRAGLFLVLLLLLFPVYAEEATGEVRAVYYQAGSSVLVDASMLRRPSAARWVDIELRNKQRALVQLPAGMQAKVGDIVAVHLAAPKSIQIAQGQPVRVSRVIAVYPGGTQLALPTQ
jgi:hypothetical protein